jgi:hypothetical protein
LIEWELVVVQMLAGPGGVAVGNKANGVIGVCGVGGLDAGNKANSVSDAVGVGAGNKTNGGVGVGKASFVAKANSSIALPSGLRFWVLVSTLP